MSAEIQIEVVDAREGRPRSHAVTVPAGTQVFEVLKFCSWMAPVEEGEGCGFAIFGCEVDATYVLQAADRLEICPPLRMTPMEARRRRAQAQRTLKK